MDWYLQTRVVGWFQNLSWRFWLQPQIINVWMAQLWVIQKFWCQLWKVGPIDWAGCQAVIVDALNCFKWFSKKLKNQNQIRQPEIRSNVTWWLIEMTKDAWSVFEWLCVLVCCVMRAWSCKNMITYASSRGEHAPKFANNGAEFLKNSKNRLQPETL